MKISMAMGYAGDFQQSIDEVKELERAGLDTVWVAEAYGFDAVSLMGYLAAVTERVEIASGILPIYTRTPTLLAMTAAGIDMLSGGRAMLGLGTSGPQVVEGWHGVPFDAPVQRLREIIDICRKVWRREVVDHQGKRYQIPLPPDRGTGLGKPLKTITKPIRDRIPIAVASLGMQSVAMTAELADAWLPVMFHPDRARERWGKALDTGRAKRSADLGPLQIYSGGMVAIGDGFEKLRDYSRPGLALYIGGMGARTKNFYNETFASFGYESEAKEIQDLYLGGKKKEAEAAIPQSFIDATTLVGPKEFVRERIAAYREAGVTGLNVTLFGRSTAEKVKTMETLRNLM
jgi:F420-dependent oxidoreductase-like protein